MSTSPELPTSIEGSPHQRQLLRFFKHQLDEFLSSGEAFRVIGAAPRNGTPDEAHNGGSGRAPRVPQRLIVLDSSFNPPTRAHMQMATDAVRDAGAARPATRLLLLLAVNNADKAPKPAAFEQRLAMMDLFARDVSEELAPAGGRAGAGADDGFGVDIALTTLPYFHDKSAALASAMPRVFDVQDNSKDSVEQVFLVGYDTLIRLFNPKYYTRTLPSGESVNEMRDALSPLFSRAKIRVTLRADADWGDRKEQLEYIEGIKCGNALEKVGGLKEWGSRIDIAESRAGGNVLSGEGAFSSTFAREAAERGNLERLRKLVPARVAAWVEVERLYGGSKEIEGQRRP